MKQVSWGSLLKIAGFLVVGQFALSGQAGAVIPKIEKDALIELFKSTGGNANWEKKTNWNVKSNACLWMGVRCNMDDTRVIGLDLDENSLTGAIPPEIGDLEMLEVLDLHSNQLSGPIPAEIGKLVNLRELQLQKNSLSGSLPAELNETKLKMLFINSNKLTGEIDAALSQGMANRLDVGGLDLRYNGLYSSDQVLLQSLNSKQIDGDIMATQTLDAYVLKTEPLEQSINLTWTSVDYLQEGGYKVNVFSEGGIQVDSARVQGRANDTWVDGKSSDSATITGLESGTFYSIEVRSLTNTHDNNELNEVISDGLLAGRVEVSTKDADSDGDGIQDNMEGKKEGLDTDGDGIPDYKDSDDDGDGFLTVVELPTSKDTDADGTPDYLDDDDDGDGVPTGVEASPVVNTNPLKKDTDNDGILDKAEIGSDYANPLDTDIDGTIDARDPDDDDDSIPTRKESREDFDGDNVPDYLDADDDGDGVPTSEEMPLIQQDTDKDGKLDYLDSDDDNDGLSTRDERSKLKTDPLSVDTDKDGIKDGDEVGENPDHPLDSDGDGVINALDEDDDNDTIPTIDEPTGYLNDDDDGDGLSTADELELGTDPNSKDSDKDGIEDGIEVGRHVDKPKNTDGDNLIDALDPDDDNDSIPTSKELPGDFDNDGKPNYLDDDDDNDGKSTLVEVQGGTGVDSDADNAPDYLDNDDAVVTTSMGGGSVGLGLLILALVAGFTRRIPLRQLFPVALLSILSGQGIAGQPNVAETIAQPAGIETIELSDESSQSMGTVKTAENMEISVEEQMQNDTVGGGEQNDLVDNVDDRLRQGGRFYLGLGAGATRLDPDPNSTAFSVEDEDDVGFKMVIGYEATDHIAIELAGGPMGEAGLTPNNRYVKYSGYTLGLVYDVFGEIGGFTPLAKIGVSKIENSANVAFNGEEDLLPFAGAGLKYEFDNGVALRGEYEYLAKDAQMLSVSLLKYFGGAPEPAPVVVTAPPPPPPPAPEVVVAFNIPDSDEDGVNDIRDGCPNTPEGARVDEAGCAMFEGVLQGVNFEYNSSNLTASAEQILDEVAAELQNYPTVKIEVQAHTDSDGSSKYNQWLSERRAMSVINYLGQQGLSTGRLVPMGYGETRPIADNSSDEGKAQNRRVEFQVQRAQ